jgi:hypothetical protein
MAAMAPKGSGLKPKSCTGQCFAAGTLVHGVVALTPIEALTCGIRVVSYVAGERIDVEPLPLVIDPLTWRAVTLVLIEPGYRLDATLLRPLDWLHGRGLGASVWLDLPHVGVRGFATIVEITACPPVETDASGRLITGTFCHSHGEVWDLVVEGEPHPIGGTAAHPVWSDDRQEWVPLSELRVGERARVLGGMRVVQSVTLRPGIEPVYNIEVEGDHCYRVGQQGLLVHNASEACSRVGITTVGPSGAVYSTKKLQLEWTDGVARDYLLTQQAIALVQKNNEGDDAAPAIKNLFKMPVRFIAPRPGGGPVPPAGTRNDWFGRRPLSGMVGPDTAGHIYPRYGGGKITIALTENGYAANAAPGSPYQDFTEWLRKRMNEMAQTDAVKERMRQRGEKVPCRICVQWDFEYKDRDYPFRPSRILVQVWLNGDSESVMKWDDPN